MFKLFLLALLSTAAVSAYRVAKAGSSSMRLQARSKAIPFVDAPAKLDGKTVGDFGFDPLGFTNTLNDLNYVQAAEIKHGRVAMLATVGFVLQQYIHILSPESNPLKAVSSVGTGVNLQVLSFIGVLELVTWKATFQGHSAGDLGFDPLGQLKGKSQKQVDELKLKELKNGRLAMVAFIGMVVQNLVFDGKATLSF